MAVRIGINGLGRIGRSFWRIARERGDSGIEVAAVNDLGDAMTLAHLLRYDSVRGRLAAVVADDAGAIVMDGVRVPVLHRPELGTMPWGDYGVDVVLESTGRFFRADEARRHLAGGARRVIISMATPDPDVTLIMGINQHEYDPQRHRVISPACCTSNAVAPVLAVLHQHFGVVTGQLTTVHAYDSTHSALHDSSYRNRRMGRSAAVNMVPSRIKDTTRALDRVFPELSGRLEGLAIRVPAAIGCAADLVVRVGRRTTAAQVNAALATAALSEFKGYLDYTEEPLVSSDIVGSTASCTVDGALTTVVGDSVKIVGWYDNEWGFASRLVDLVSLVGSGAEPGSDESRAVPVAEDAGSSHGAGSPDGAGSPGPRTAAPAAPADRAPADQAPADQALGAPAPGARAPAAPGTAGTDQGLVFARSPVRE